MTKNSQTNAPPEHPYLLKGSHYPIVHFDAAQSDTTAFGFGSGDREVTPEQIDFKPGGMGNGGFAHVPYADGSEAIIASGSARLVKYLIGEDGTLNLINEVRIPDCETCDNEYMSAEEMSALVDDLDAAGTDDAAFVAITQEVVNRTGFSGETVANGMYTLIDRDGYYYAGYGTVIHKFSDEKTRSATSEITHIGSRDIRVDLPEDIRQNVSRLLGLNLTYDGHLVVVLAGGVGVLDRKTLRVRAFAELAGEAIDNGVVVDRRGGFHGIYVVTSKYMRKLVWKDYRGAVPPKETDCILSSDEEDGFGAWKETYDGALEDGSSPVEGSFSKGSGTTPTLMGFGSEADRLVLISGAATETDQSVKLIAYWRDEIPTGTKNRVAGSATVSIPVSTTIEWSPLVLGYGAMVVNGEFQDPVTDPTGEVDVLSSILTLGQTRRAPRGVEKLEWDPQERVLKSAWVYEDEDLPWSLSPIPTAGDVVYINIIKDAVYSLVGLDWTTGAKVGSIKLGQSVKFNTGGTFVSPQADGSLYLHGFFGPVRIADILK